MISVKHVKLDNGREYEVRDGNSILHREIPSAMTAIRLALVESRGEEEVKISKTVAGDACDEDRGNTPFSRHSMNLQGLTITA